VDAFDLVVGATAFDGGPFDNGSAAGYRVAHIRLLEDLFETGAGAAVSEELIGGEVSVASVVDEVEEAEFDGVGDGDAEVEVPGGGRIFDWGRIGFWMLDSGCWMGGIGRMGGMGSRFVMRDA